MSKHTKGPWKAEIHENRKGAGSVEIWNHNSKIATINSNSVFKNEFITGNANLIAAAPELLDEVKTLVNILENGTETSDDLDGAVEWAKQLIAKAEGSGS